MIEYRDPITGYMIRRYTEGPERNSKLYFTSENFSVDDKYFFFNENQTYGCNDGGCYRCSRRASSRPYGNETFHGLFRR